MSRRSPRIPLLLAPALAAALALSACGGAAEPDGDAAAQARGDSAAYVVPSTGTVSSGDAPSVARFPGGHESDEVSETGASDANPCHLVPSGEAAAILGERVRTSVGPRGPTCIYEPTGSRQLVTVVVERTDLEGLRRRAASARPMRVGAREGWCLRYGSASVVVPLASGTVLHVTGPCPLAARFAARALERV